MFKKVGNQLYLLYYKYKNKKNGCVFTRKAIISSTDLFEGNNYISGKVTDCKVGFGTYISDGCFVRNCKIGRFCSIAPEVRVLRGNHPLSDFVSTSPAFHLKASPVGKSYVERDLFDTQKKKRPSSNNQGRQEGCSLLHASLELYLSKGELFHNPPRQQRWSRLKPLLVARSMCGLKRQGNQKSKIQKGIFSI